MSDSAIRYRVVPDWRADSQRRKIATSSTWPSSRDLSRDLSLLASLPVSWPSRSAPAAQATRALIALLVAPPPRPSSRWRSRSPASMSH
jgi:hypothetical protein